MELWLELKYRVSTRNGLDTSKTRRSEYPDRRAELPVKKGINNAF